MPPTGNGITTFAVTELFLGDTDPCSPPAGSVTCAGTPDMGNGWKQYGFDIDGFVSTAASTNLCKPVMGATAQNVYPDGNAGIDNSFGKLLLPIILSVMSNESQTLNQAIKNGSFTLMFSMVNLGTGATQSPLLTRFYNGAPLGSAPKFDGTDAWPVTNDSVTNPNDITTAVVQFPMSYVTNDTWVSGAGPTGAGKTFTLQTGFIPLPIGVTRIAFQLDPAHKNGVSGIISGVMDTATVEALVVQQAGLVDPTLCSGAVIQSILAQIAGASDILNDGTQDPTKSCNGISIGLGFNATIVQLGAVAAPVAPSPNPCDAGAD
jgi:hypothetical protein